MRDLAAAEWDCCAFFRFDVAHAGDEVELTVVAPPEAQAALRFLFPR